MEEALAAIDEEVIKSDRKMTQKNYQKFKAKK